MKYLLGGLIGIVLAAAAIAFLYGVAWIIVEAAFRGAGL